MIISASSWMLAQWSEGAVTMPAQGIPARSLVLVLDPSREDAGELIHSLQERFNVLFSATISEALQALRTYRPAIVLLADMSLPDGDALALVRHLRGLPGGANLVIACISRRTSESMLREKVTAFQAGADDFVVRPVNLATFAFRLVLLQRVKRLSSYEG
jgi:DNA-binding response OmpR family regulator